MIKTRVSGSSSSKNPIVGSMNFMKNGDVSLTVCDKNDTISIHDKSALLITSEFLMYALEKDEWMLEFLNVMNKNLEAIERRSLRRRFEVIDGGLSNDPDDLENT